MSKTVLLRSVVPGLSGLTDEHNRRHPEDRLRFRAVLHASEVHHDPHGPLTYTAFSTRRNPSTWDEGWLHVPGDAVHTYLDSGLADRSSVTT